MLVEGVAGGGRGPMPLNGVMAFLGVVRRFGAGNLGATVVC